MSTKEISVAVSEAVAGEMTGKKWYFSKTFWTNVVMALAVTVQSKYGFVVGPELQALVITGVNLILRKLSKEAIIW